MDLETKHSAKWNEGVLHLVSVQEPLLTTLKELNYNSYAGYRRVQFQKNKSASSFRIWRRHRVRQKVMKTCEAIMDTAEPGTSADTEKPTTSSFVEVRDFLCSIEVAISALLRIKCYT